MPKHKINEITKKALTVCMDRFAKDHAKDVAYEHVINFDQKTGAPLMSTEYLAEEYDCTKVYIRFIIAHGVHTLDGVDRLARIFNMKASAFIALGE